MEPTTLPLVPALPTKTVYIYHTTIAYVNRAQLDGRLGWLIGVREGYEMFVTDPPSLAKGDPVRITVEKAQCPP